ncbi:hypothetical protein [uncultured Corynebacterium sp.]|uniref:hypothetical protein n=1 Tax=uncultured Corynebacterium sp. TaxID=159447 RepID=UPI0025F58CFF|nr:hypothetical protein [uncultured Corynebacterium sp.]
MDLPGIGYGQSAEEASSVQLVDAADIAWTPHVTRGVRLISIVQDAQAYVIQVSYAAGASDASAWRMRRRLAAVHALH